MLRLVLLLLLLATPLRADVASVQILPGWRDGGQHFAGVQISLQPGWKTYWRSPGDAGIPPSFNWSGSRNLAELRIAWPTPHVFSQGGLRSVGYEGGVVLPLIVTPRDPSQPVSLRLALDMGVCRDVCVPVSSRVAAELGAAAARPDARIRAALSDRPLSGAEAGAGQLDCDLRPGARGIGIAASLRLSPMGGTEHAVIELADPRLWVSAPELTRDGDTLRIRADVHPPRNVAAVVDRDALRLTVMGRNGAVEIVGCD
ncbi:hypothetical protein ILP92_01195 [Maribius pontilimi]|uniref:Thiol:disulfide interchange protein DsbD N-terminal domain-containing protein n=1 Tax=Palleronia pontilimi TaxID=1964209 RepID=A0A934IDV4_9RHOB|nr:protein-disulfide reductase DsbD domain-containing protein [Palleronia pontilimi]MBJ3761367.1 hypothetical protein [Palleronia pontilimi]